MLLSTLLISCAQGFQTFNKYGISFTVFDDLKLEEYTINLYYGTFFKGSATYDVGAIVSSDKSFVFVWGESPEFTSELVRTSILSTRNLFQSTSGTFRAEVTGELVREQIGGFDVTFAGMHFSQPGWEAPGITAVWYCQNSGRIMQVVIINKYPERELRRFMLSLSC